MSTKDESARREPDTLERETGSRLGQIVEGSTPDRLLVDYPGNPFGPLPALSVLALDKRCLEYAIVTRQPSLLMFEQGDPKRPIVVGLVQPSSAQESELRSLLVATKSARSEPREARIDGEYLTLEGYEQVTLKCGEASITLLKNGKVQLKGVYIETDAVGVNRIKGGTVKIN
jgi:Domain of unknown function (DUF6484)